MRVGVGFPWRAWDTRDFPVGLNKLCSLWAIKQVMVGICFNILVSLNKLKKITFLGCGSYM